MYPPYKGPGHIGEIIPSKIEGRLSNELYMKIERMKYTEDNDKLPKSLGTVTRWIHLQDAVSIGTISPLEAYEALKLGYVPDHLLVRQSHYYHLFKEHCSW